MSTTVELVRANERYARLRAAVEALAAEYEADRDVCVAWIKNPEMHVDDEHPFRLSQEAASLNRTAKSLRALLAAVDS